ncbi:MAG: hypothetical protein IKT42_00910 [Clostridia bacterium]|nr:hypothetical protein [Clostridia bacterium]
MAKFTDTIKGFINKHFTGEVTCAHCGKKGKVMFFSTMSDDNRLCSSCKNSIPAEFHFNPKESTLEEFKNLDSFMQYTKNQLEPVFEPDREFSYGDFKVDPVNCLCKVNNSFVFEISNILAYDFSFRAEEFKDGIFSSKVKGDVYLNTLILREPGAVFGETAIKYSAKGKAEKKMFSSTVTYQNPADLDEFLMKFDALWSRFENERQQQEFDDLVEQKAKELLAQRERATLNA